MIPLYDDVPTRRTPVLTIILIVINVVAYLLQLAVGLDQSVVQFGLIPAELLQNANEVWTAPGGEVHNLDPAWITILTSMFMHGGLAHIGGNMLFLWVFGNNIEDDLGSGRFIFFYLLCGGIAAMAQSLLNPSSPVPMVGASGAVAGVLGAYLVLHPRARIMCLIMWFFIMVRPLPAKLVLVLWFVLQVFEGMGTLGRSIAHEGGVAYAAHIGGFIAGFVLIRILGGRPDPPPLPRYRPPPDFMR